MIVGIDFHGVIDLHTGIMFNMINSLIRDGNYVHLMTGARRVRFDEECKMLNIKVPFTHFFSISDYLIENYKDKIDMADPDHPRCEDKELWDIQKALYAKRVGVDLIIDDEVDYAKYFERYNIPVMIMKNFKNKNKFK